MSDQPEKRQVRRLRWVAAVFLLLLAAILMVPFLLTTQLMRLALGQVFPASHLSVGSAVLSLSGTLVLHDIVLHDTGELAQQPLVTAREVDAAFGWAELLSRRMRRIQANGVTVYARPNGPSQLSLLDLFPQKSQSGSPAEANRGTLPIWIDTLHVQGMIHLAPMRGFVSASADWPLALHMTMSGDRMDPSRQCLTAIGETWQLPEKIPATPFVAAPASPPGADAAFGLLMEVETQPAVGGTRVVVHRLAASPASSKHVFALDGLTAMGSVESQLKPWAPAALKVRAGVLLWATLNYNDHALNRLDATWRLDGQTLMIEGVAAQIFDGHISGLLAWDLGTHAMPRCDVQLNSINMHAALANVSPAHLDAEGSASGFLLMVLSEEGELSGRLELAFDGPGILRSGESEEVKQMLVGDVGLALANLALQDLQRYPFTEGRLCLESLGKNSELKIKFVRQPRNEADVTPPHKEIIQWPGSLGRISGGAFD